MNNSDSTKPCTRTLAALYERQGYIREALDMYRCLLEQNPDCREISDAVTRLETGLREEGSRNRQIEELAPLLEEWIGLLMSCAAIKRLKKIVLHIS